MTATAAGKTLLTNAIPRLWAALMVQDPKIVQDPLTVELVSQVYSRPEFYNAGTYYSISFPGIPAGTSVAAIGLFNAAVNGSLRFVYVYDSPLLFSKGGSISIAANQLLLPID